MTLKHAMNGAPVPNWMKAGFFWLGIGWIAATTVIGSKATVQATTEAIDKKLAIKMAVDDEKVTTINNKIDSIDNKIEAIDGRLRGLELRVDYRSRQNLNAIDGVHEDLQKVARKVRH